MRRLYRKPALRGLRLSELELIERHRRMIERRIKAAKFTAVKSLDSFDFKAMPSLNKVMVMERKRPVNPLCL